MKTLDGLLSVERLTSMSLTGDGDESVGVQVRRDAGVIAEAPLLFPGKRCGVGEIEGDRYLRFHFIDVLSTRTARAREGEG